MTVSVGFDPTNWYTLEELNQQGKGALNVGQRITTHDGKVYVLVKLSTGGVTGDGYVCSFGNDYLALMVDTDVAGSILEGDYIGVAEGAGLVDEYGWLQIYGACGIRSEQDALANKKLAATADAGQIDDAAATGIFINGMHLGTATGGADAVNTTGFLNYPTLEVQMEPET